MADADSPNEEKITVNVNNSPKPDPDPTPTAPTVSSMPKPPTQEDDLKAAAAEMAEEETQAPPANRAVVGMQPKKSRKGLLIVLLVLILLAGAAAAWYFLINKKSNTATNTQPTQTAPTETTPTFEADNVVYAFKATAADPFSVYYRPAAGGDRKEATKLTKDQAITSQDVVGSDVVYVAENNMVYLSKDSGKTYKKIYDSTSDDIISIKLSSEADGIAIGQISRTNGPNKIITISLSGSDSQTVAEGDKAMQVFGYSKAKHQVFYNEGCWACDGPRTAYKYIDTSTKKVTNLVDDLNTKTFGFYKLSDDLTKFIYVEGTDDSANQPEGLGGFGSAPYKVNLLNVSDKKVTLVDTVGTKGEKNTNGTAKYRKFIFGFLAGTNTPYYAEGKELKTITNNKSSLVFEGDKDILGVFYASDKNIVVSTGKDTADFLLSNYSVSDKKSTTIFSGDNNTEIFGVTTK